MSQIRFNQAFIGLMAAGVASMFFIPPSVTDRAKGKEELLLLPVVRPARAVASMFHSRYGEKRPPPGETSARTYDEVLHENGQLQAEVLNLGAQLDKLLLVQAERKRRGKLMDHFDTVGTVGGDASPGSESLGLMPASGVNLDEGAWILCDDGVVGQIRGHRVRLITDKGFIMSGSFGRSVDGKWVPLLGALRGSVVGIGGGAMRINHLTLKEVEGLKPTDWVVVADVDPAFREFIQRQRIGQVDSIRPLASNPLFADIIVKPTVELGKLDQVLALKKPPASR